MTAMMDFDKLSEKARNGTITRSEVAEVASALMKAKPDDRRYSMLHIIGLSHSREYEDLVASFLECPDDPDLTCLSLLILTGYWGLSEEYLTWARKYINGVEWDILGTVKGSAITAAGRYLRKRRDGEIAALLLSVVNSDKENEVDRSTAYCALEAGYGVDPIEYSVFDPEFDIEYDMDPEILEWASELASNKTVH